jgi:hypothetical protein
MFSIYINTGLFSNRGTFPFKETDESQTFLPSLCGGSVYRNIT